MCRGRQRCQGRLIDPDYLLRSSQSSFKFMVFLAYGIAGSEKPYDLEHNHNICFILILNDLFSATYVEQSLTKMQTKALFQTINDF